MRIIIQDTRTFLYLQPDSTWNRSSQTARVFENSADALNYCEKRNTCNGQLIMQFPEANVEVLIPMRCHTADKD